MPNSGDVVDLDLGVPEGSEAGFRHPAILVTAQRILDADPSVVHVVPLTTTLRPFHSEIVIQPDGVNGLDHISAAQCQHLRAISPRRILGVHGNVGPVTLGQIRETIALILDMPGTPTVDELLLDRAGGRAGGRVSFDVAAEVVRNEREAGDRR